MANLHWTGAVSTDAAAADHCLPEQPPAPGDTLEMAVGSTMAIHGNALHGDDSTAAGFDAVVSRAWCVGMGAGAIGAECAGSWCGGTGGAEAVCRCGRGGAGAYWICCWGMAQICEAVAEKAQQIPFRASLDFRSGNVGDDPLRHATVLAIALGLEDQRAVGRAA
jgi:hypothetical protein